MGTKRVQKTRTVTKNRWNATTGSFEPVSVPETYWDTEYVADTTSSFNTDNSSPGGYGE
jgi:hypothetical protein